MKKLVLVLVLATAGCATQRRPILYPNAKERGASLDVQKQDVDECMRLAETDLASGNARRVGEGAAASAGGGAVVGAAGGAAAGAVLGRAGRKAEAGAAGGGAGGLMHGLLRGLHPFDGPDKVHRKFVEQCLRERGYRTVGWQ